MTHAGSSLLPPALAARLGRLALAVRRPASSPWHGSARSQRRGRGLAFADFRPYTDGDEPRRIDWRGFARHDRLYVKQFEEDRDRTLTLLLDTSASMDWGDGAEHKGRFARSLAAALAAVALAERLPVQVFLLNGAAATALPVLRRRLYPLLDRLAQVHEEGPTTLSAALAAVARQRPPAGPRVLISDLLDPDWPSALPLLAAPGSEPAVLQVLAAAEWEPLLDEDVELVDVETGAKLETSLCPAALAAYQSRLDAFVAGVRQSCRRLGALYAALNPSRGLSETLLGDLPAAGLLTLRQG